MSKENANQSPLLLAAWSVTTTLSDWVKFSPDMRRRTIHYAWQLKAPKQTYRSRWEAAATQSIIVTLSKDVPKSGQTRHNPFKGY